MLHCIGSIGSKKYMKRSRRHNDHHNDDDAFTLVEVLLVVAIIAVLATIVIVAINPYKILANTKEVRANIELSQIQRALHLYYLEHLEWPADVSRGLPSGIEDYLGPGTWPDAPFSDFSQYDWDNFIGSDGNQVLQISIRFCPLGDSSACEFPDEEWAADFDYYSSYYFCIRGICRSHPSRPDDHPGYCVNC